MRVERIVACHYKSFRTSPLSILLLKEFSMRSLLPIAVLALTASSLIADDLPTLRVSNNQRYLETQDGKPFFWLGDTAWELFHRLNREEAIQYLEHRAAHGYNVIQAVALAELDGLTEPNAYGHLPLQKNDPTKPTLVEGANNDYWDHVDFVVKEANKRGIYIGFLPTWGDKWNKKWGVGPEVFNPENARVYGEFIGKRYKNSGVVWILGGDRPLESELQKEVIRKMVEGLKAGDEGRHLCTFHPTGGASSSEHLHNEAWLDFNMRQNGHTAEFTGRYDATAKDYALQPTKPVLDGEPIYEDHPISFDANKFGHSIAADVRRPLYWNLFTGAFGHTYGNHAVWQMWTAKRNPVNNPLMKWDEAIKQPGAEQMKYGRRLIESRPFLTRIPDSSIIVTDRVATSVPGAGRYRFVATRDEAGTYAMIYAPIGRSFSVKMDVIRAANVKAWWFNPRKGNATLIGTFSNQGVKVFTPPDSGEMLDWVLVLDDATQNYAEPGNVVTTAKANKD